MFSDEKQYVKHLRKARIFLRFTTYDFSTWSQTIANVMVYGFVEFLWLY